VAEWYLFVPQVRVPVAALVERAQHAEASGFTGIAFCDHLEAPGLPNENIWEAMSVATWVAAKTERLRIGHLVLCDAFRHPAVLAKQVATLSDASGGRFDLGLGTGSYLSEFDRFDLPQQNPRARIEQLGRHLDLIADYWGRGGTGPRMMELVRKHADWWNIPANQLDRLTELAPSAGSARVSIQQMIGFVRKGDDPTKVHEVSTRRFGSLGYGLTCGDADELSGHFSELSGQGVERFYVWFADFAAPESLREFGETVIKNFGV
jgi:alkanesulfonate monooxygenase SsuD/methylene tetrahydromethanopterin reductase-like flavin-dependent oxidoreductase (luciferase family)